jgi:hypothetical protein
MNSNAPMRNPAKYHDIGNIQDIGIHIIDAKSMGIGNLNFICAAGNLDLLDDIKIGVAACSAFTVTGKRNAVTFSRRYSTYDNVAVVTAYSAYKNSGIHLDGIISIQEVSGKLIILAPAGLDEFHIDERLRNRWDWDRTLLLSMFPRDTTIDQAIEKSTFVEPNNFLTAIADGVLVSEIIFLKKNEIQFQHTDEYADKFNRCISNHFERLTKLNKPIYVMPCVKAFQKFNTNKQEKFSIVNDYFINSGLSSFEYDPINHTTFFGNFNSDVKIYHKGRSYFKPRVETYLHHALDATGSAVKADDNASLQSFHPANVQSLLRKLCGRDVANRYNPKHQDYQDYQTVETKLVDRPSSNEQTVKQQTAASAEQNTQTKSVQSNSDGSEKLDGEVKPKPDSEKAAPNKPKTEEQKIPNSELPESHPVEDDEDDNDKLDLTFI